MLSTNTGLCMQKLHNKDVKRKYAYQKVKCSRESNIYILVNALNTIQNANVLKYNILINAINIAQNPYLIKHSTVMVRWAEISL